MFDFNQYCIRFKNVDYIKQYIWYAGYGNTVLLYEYLGAKQLKAVIYASFYQSELKHLRYSLKYGGNLAYEYGAVVHQLYCNELYNCIQKRESKHE